MAQRMTLQEIIDETSRTKLRAVANDLGTSIDRLIRALPNQEAEIVNQGFAAAGAFAVAMYRLEYESPSKLTHP